MSENNISPHLASLNAQLDRAIERLIAADGIDERYAAHCAVAEAEAMIDIYHEENKPDRTDLYDKWGL